MRTRAECYLCVSQDGGAIAEFTVAAIPQPHDPKAPLVLVCSKLATANTTVGGAAR